VYFGAVQVKGQWGKKINYKNVCEVLDLAKYESIQINRLQRAGHEIGRAHV
jgi:hypothetical protein